MRRLPIAEGRELEYDIGNQCSWNKLVTNVKDIYD